MRDPPDTEANKGGLFPTAIKHHVELGFDVHVASMSEMTQRHKDVINSLGATPFEPSMSVPEIFAKLRRFLLGNGKRARGPDLTSKKNLTRIASEISPGIVTGLQSYPTGLIAEKIASFLEVEYITWEHVSSYERSTPLSVSDPLMIEFLRGARAVLGVSSSLLNAINQRFSIALSNSSVLPNPIPLNYTQPLKSEVPHWLAEIPKPSFVFASWTSWRRLKRLDILLDAFEKIWKAKKDVTLVVAGPIDEETAKVHRDFSDRHPDVSSAIVFTGALDRESIRHLAEVADCCIIPSDFETFGLQMVEALSLGTPVISTKCGGPEDILGDKRLGLLCEKDNADALSSAMLHVHENHDTYRSEDIANIANNLLGHETIKRKWAAVYEGIAPIGRNTT